MVSATAATQTDNRGSVLLNSTVPSSSINSFAQQLATALEQYLSQSGGQSGNGSQIEISVQPSSSQNSSGAQQIVVTLNSPQSSFPNSTQSSTKASVTSAPSGSAAAASAVPLTSYAPTDYTEVPFGNSTTMVPTLSSYLAGINAQMAIETPAQIQYDATVVEAGDPMAGQTISGTNLKWDNLTQDQRLAWEYATNYGIPNGQSMQQVLEANVGPQIAANAPPKDLGMFSNS